MSEGRGVQSIEVGSRLLDAMISAGEPMMLRDIASLAGVAPPQAHAYLVSYRNVDLVERDERTGRYRLGPMALHLGIARLRTFDPLHAADEEASALVADTGLTVAISVWGSYGPTVIQVHEGTDQVLISTRPGTVYSMTGTATGRIFIAFLPSDLVATGMKAQRAEKHAERIVGKVSDLRETRSLIDFVRAHGYAPTESTPLPGINAVAAPVFDLSGQLSMAVTMIGASAHLDVGPKSKHVQKTVELAERISKRSGFFRPTV